MNKISVNDVCRLCLTEDDLVWIFHKRLTNSENMKDVIYMTTGVEITIKDIVSQKICKKCCEVTIKMFEFRRKSLQNDKQLREQCNRSIKEKNIKIPNTQVTIKSKTKTDVKSEKPKMEQQSQESEKTIFKVHPSVRDLFKVYPQIKLPTVCLKAHIEPFVSLQLDEVEDYFKKRKLDMYEHSKLALKYSKAAARSTAVPITSRTSICSLSDNKSVQIDISKNKHSNETLVCPVKISQRKPSYEVSSQRNGNVQSKQNQEAQSKESHEVQSKLQSKQTHEAQSKERQEIQNKQIREIQSKQNHEVQNKPNHDPVIENPGKSVFKSTDPTKVSDHAPGKSSEYKKRKLSELANSSENQSNKMPASVDSMELTPKTNVVPSTAATEPDVIVANTSVPLYICDFCNSVQYSSKDLRKHQNKHLRCQFCKILFRTLENKKHHIKSKCIIKNAMNNLPDVEVVKVEHNPKVRLKYPEAFVDFPPLEGVHHNLDNVKVSEPIQQSFEDVSYKNSNTLEVANPLKSDISKNAVEVIEIISDDEEPPASKATSSISTSTHNNSGKKVKKRPVPNANVLRTYSKKGKSANIPVVGYSKVSPPTQLIDNTVYNTVSIVRPDIRLTDNPILDNMLDPRLPDIKVLKELLICKPIQLSAEKNVQTDLPPSRSIIVNKKDSSVEFQQLKPQLYVYKIPITIKNGPLSVSYSYHTVVKQPKKLSLWNDLMPMDIKVNTITVLNSDKGSQPVEDLHNRQQHSDKSVPFSTCEKKTGDENTNVQPNNDSSTPVTPTDTSPVSNLPSQFVTTAPTYSCLNRNVMDATLSSSSVNIINMNPLLNNFLQTPVTTTIAQTLSSTVVSTSSTETIPSNNVIPFGTIRVRNVWELT